MNSGPKSPPPGGVPTNGSRRARLWLVGVLSFLAVSVAILLARVPRMPKVTIESLAAARQQWRDAGLEDYDLTVEVRGRQAAVYRVEVRGGEVQRATRNDAPLRGYRTLGTWSVPGMFDTMEVDLEHQQRAERSDGAGLPQVELRAEFDERTGLPRRCHRIQWGGPGANPDVVWEVREFEPRDGSSPDADGSKSPPIPASEESRREGDREGANDE